MKTFKAGAISSLSFIYIFQNILFLFQFQYGAIKRNKQGGYLTQKGNFNSSMVRLKVFFIFIFIKNFVLFQFQYGAIKRIDIPAYWL